MDSKQLRVNKIKIIISLIVLIASASMQGYIYYILSPSNEFPFEQSVKLTTGEKIECEFRAVHDTSYWFEINLEYAQSNSQEKFNEIYYEDDLQILWRVEASGSLIDSGQFSPNGWMPYSEITTKTIGHFDANPWTKYQVYFEVKKVAEKLKMTNAKIKVAANSIYMKGEAFAWILPFYTSALTGLISFIYLIIFLISRVEIKSENKKEEELRWL